MLVVVLYVFYYIVITTNSPKSTTVIVSNRAGIDFTDNVVNYTQSPRELSL